MQPAQAGWLLPGTQPDLAATFAGEAKAVRVLIGAAIRFMIDVARLRARVILRLLDETGARLHEVLAMTAGGYRKRHSR
jgi:hypothetical protein